MIRFFILCLLALPLFAADEAEQPEQIEAEKRLAALGELKEELGLWMGMDSTERGGITWTRFPFSASASEQVQRSKQAGRQWLDFSKPGALVRFEKPLVLGTKYTVCVWVLFPSPHAHALIWQAGTTGGGAIHTDDLEVFCWDDALGAHVKLATFPAKQDGWQHLAVSADGKVTRTFLNGKEIGRLASVPFTKILTMGNHWNKDHQHWMMASGLDDHLIFRRPLTEEEIRKVMEFERPPAEKGK
jgi:hypothetical protein